MKIAVPSVKLERSSPLSWERPILEDSGVARKHRLRLRMESHKAKEHRGSLQISRYSESEAPTPAMLKEIGDRRQDFKTLFEAGLRG